MIGDDRQERAKWMHEESNLKHQSIALGPSNGKVHPSLRGWWVLIVSCNTRITFHVLTYFIAYHNIGGCTGSRTPKKPNRSCGCCPPAECSQYFFGIRATPFITKTIQCSETSLPFCLLNHSPQSEETFFGCFFFGCYHS